MSHPEMSNNEKDGQRATLLTTPEKKSAEKGKKSAARNFMEWVVLIVVAVALSLLIRSFIFEPVRVDGYSMQDTLQDNEFVFVSKFDYIFGDPQRGDVVICRYPERSEIFVKRVIGLPGDTVSGDNSYVYINGTALDEDYIGSGNKPFNEHVLGEDQYLVMGDNRSNSNDGRAIGAIPSSYIMGRVRFVLWPVTHWRTIPSVDAYVQ